ncbi:MAG: FecR domain-containing protein [Candidatus Omnitrophica bacterium]|nr:FecR domain-containing protein [Candidatus Omnitrophota bacterium]
METEMKEEKVLTKRQQGALERLKLMPTPSAPALRPALLLEAPWIYRFLTPERVFITAAGFLLLALFALPYASVPENWLGPVVLHSGSTITLAAGKNCEIQLPRDEGICILQGPAHLSISRISRDLLTGQMEAAMELNYGDLYLKVDPASAKRIQIQTPLIAVRITGTELLVGHRPEEGSRVWVTRGMVSVRSGDGSQEWEPLTSGMELSKTPQGQVLRQPYSSLGKPSGRMDDLELKLPGMEEESSAPLDITRLLWHEESRR